MDAEFLDKKIEKDFYNDLPGFVCESLDSIIKKYGDQPWFLEAWNEYRNHVLESSMDDVRMPGFVFKKYIDNKIEHSDLFANDDYYVLIGGNENYIRNIQSSIWGNKSNAAISTDKYIRIAFKTQDPELRTNWITHNMMLIPFSRFVAASPALLTHMF